AGKGLYGGERLEDRRAGYRARLGRARAIRRSHGGVAAACHAFGALPPLEKRRCGRSTASAGPARHSQAGETLGGGSAAATFVPCGSPHPENSQDADAGEVMAHFTLTSTDSSRALSYKQE